jgi:hypothetical protein
MLTHVYENPSNGKKLGVTIVRYCGTMVVVAGADGQPFTVPESFLRAA